MGPTAPKCRRLYPKIFRACRAKKHFGTYGPKVQKVIYPNLFIEFSAPAARREALWDLRPQSAKAIP